MEHYGYDRILDIIHKLDNKEQWPGEMKGEFFEELTTLQGRYDQCNNITFFEDTESLYDTLKELKSPWKFSINHTDETDLGQLWENEPRGWQDEVQAALYKKQKIYCARLTNSSNYTKDSLKEKFRGDERLVVIPSDTTSNDTCKCGILYVSLFIPSEITTGLLQLSGFTASGPTCKLPPFLLPRFLKLQKDVEKLQKLSKQLVEEKDTEEIRKILHLNTALDLGFYIGYTGKKDSELANYLEKDAHPKGANWKSWANKCWARVAVHYVFLNAQSAYTERVIIKLAKDAHRTRLLKSTLLNGKGATNDRKTGTVYLSVYRKIPIPQGARDLVRIHKQEFRQQQPPIKECTSFVPATTAPMINTNVKGNSNPNPNPNLNPCPTLNQTPYHHPHSNSLLSEISSQEQFLPEQMPDQHEKTRNEEEEKKELNEREVGASRVSRQQQSPLHLISLSKHLISIIDKMIHNELYSSLFMSNLNWTILADQVILVRNPEFVTGQLLHGILMFHRVNSVSLLTHDFVCTSTSPHRIIQLPHASR